MDLDSAIIFGVAVFTAAVVVSAVFVLASYPDSR